MKKHNWTYNKYRLLIIMGVFLMTGRLTGQVADTFCVAAPKEQTIELTPPEISCDSLLKLQAHSDALTAYNDAIAAIIAQKKKESDCVSSDLIENMSVKYKSTEHHYTLYYYDQGGNLIQTIPPAGVDPVDDPHFANGVYDGTQPTHDPEHISRYQYNTVGQIVEQISPDGGRSVFQYDPAQRLRFSQNANQLPLDSNNVSYTKFDPIGRVIEVGELVNTLPGPGDILDQNYPDGNVNKRDVVNTIYDFTMPPGTIPAGNTRGRVAAIANDSMRTYFDYDALGNVRELTHLLNPEILHDDTITMEYDFDLVSGNVNAFRYEQGELDQFEQRFTYDADNRIKQAYSSENGFLFDEDARYFYYLHGPLARAEYGNDKVQGMDYFYTLQGWIKGVNMVGDEDGAYDPGQDGFRETNTSLHKYLGVDSMAYTLGYHDMDYTPINAFLPNAFTSYWPALSPSILPLGSDHGLFNGNIALMLTENSMGLQGMAYQYDALHRIKNSTSYHWTGTSWDHSEDYKTAVTYDANGNLKTIYRKAFGAVDNFGLVPVDGHPNQLDHITGNTNVAIIPVQVSDNYKYDFIGNLIQNKSEGLTSEGTKMDWDVFGKLRNVEGTPDGSLRYNYDPQGNRLIKDLPDADLKDVYIRDAAGNIIAIYQADSPDQTYIERLKEFQLYGSSHLGMIRPDRLIYSTEGAPDEHLINSTRNLKSYESANHLGNVLTVFSDRKLGIDNNGDEDAEKYITYVESATDYYPFGLEMPGRKKSPDTHRYGFNGKEKDRSFSSLNHYDYGFRIYNAALGRFLSVDPLSQNYPYYSPYVFSGNKPIKFVDLDGLEIYDRDASIPTGVNFLSESILPINFNIKRDYSIKAGSFMLYGVTSEMGEWWIATKHTKNGYEDIYVVGTESVGEFRKNAWTYRWLANVRDWGIMMGGYENKTLYEGWKDIVSNPFNWAIGGQLWVSTFKVVSGATAQSLENFNFAQVGRSTRFSDAGIEKFSKLAGYSIETVDDLTNALRSKHIVPSEIPLDYVVQQGQGIILNTRTSAALNNAGIPISEWHGINRTGHLVPDYPIPGTTFDDLLNNQLTKNGLPPTGTQTIPD